MTSKRPPDRFHGVCGRRCESSTTSLRSETIAVHVHVSETRILRVLIIGFVLASCLTGCPLKSYGAGEPEGPAPATDASSSQGLPTDDDVAVATRPACEPLPEEAVCNGLDEDCDGLTDEDCTLRLGGHVLGAGFVSAQDAGLVLAGVAGSRRFIGTSSDGEWTIRGGLAPRAGDE